MNHCRDGHKESSTFLRKLSKREADYVTRRFNASSAKAEEPVGLDLRWDTALRDFQIQLELEPQRGMERNESSLRRPSRKEL
jgi:hypothetical protein